MPASDLLERYPHRRFNPLTREWILVSPHRAKRPWQGQVEKHAEPVSVRHDPGCYLCPGNARAGGRRNPPYESTFVFDNDFAALLPDAPAATVNESGLLVAETERGICRVVCFSPDHSLSVSRLPRKAIEDVVDAWVAQYGELGAIPWIRSVQIFENRGGMMGASNPHPHCQIWANSTIPGELSKELAAFGAYNGCLLCDYLALEKTRCTRVVLENDAFTVMVPFWAVWPFETLVIPRRHLSGMDQLEPGERSALADVLKRITTRYDNLFETPFPYTMGFHQRPTDGGAHDGFHFHAHFYPPLLRSATVRKFMVGYEMLGNPQRDITAETAAERLRALSDRHYAEAAR
ncbi:MAG: UDP-glucose--hexose-1-phosphate uridylyltransferase [Bryobacterales bacterium]|nr:UDP-glucose--hexose-1-phosphate uridylyltransferase [Bryobacterales bacterium]